MLKATKVDGVYNVDPEKNPHAIRYEKLTFSQVLKDNLSVMDMAAISICQEGKMPILVFNFKRPETSSVPSPAILLARWSTRKAEVRRRKDESRPSRIHPSDFSLPKWSTVMTSDEILMDAEERMEKAVKVFSDELRGLRTGRATPALVDSLRVEYYGSLTPLKQLANISTPDPQQIVIRPFDQGALKDIEKAIRSSDLGMSPSNDGKMIRLQVPAMSGEQRQKLVTRIKKSSEDAKVACRNVRRDSNKQFDLAEKAKEMTEDERDQGKEEVQTLLKKFEDKVAELAEKKTKEILEQ